MVRSNSRSTCPISNVLEILGDRWTLLVVRDMMFRGKQEFGQFMKSSEKISSNILADRLNRLCENNLLSKTVHVDDKKKYVYELTQTGLDLAPVMLELVLWSAKSLDNVSVPEAVLNMVMNNRESVIERIQNREVLSVL